jgi:hypothetical protein
MANKHKRHFCQHENQYGYDEEGDRNGEMGYCTHDTAIKS